MVTFQYQRRHGPEDPWKTVSIIQCHPTDVSRAIDYIVGNDMDGRMKRVKTSIAVACTDASGPIPLKVLAKGVPEACSE